MARKRALSRSTTTCCVHVRIDDVGFFFSKHAQEADEADFELGDLAERTTIGAPALNVHAYDFETEDFAFDARRGMDFDLLPAPDYKERRGAATTALSIPAFGQAVTAVKGWWTEEFTFRGFGVGIVKPIFRGMLLRPDVGVGIRYVTVRWGKVRYTGCADL